MGRVLILVAVVLALANAQCFARCLAQPTGTSEGSMPCHSHGKAKVTGQQHDLQITRVTLPTPPACAAPAGAIVPTPAARVAPAPFRLATSPPPLGPATPLSLRI